MAGAEGGRKVEPTPASEQAARAFTVPLSWHSDNGTRAEGKTDRWSAGECGKLFKVTNRTVRNWRNGTYLLPL
jgi:hypothetical protein